MSLVKCQECGDIIESTDQKACVKHAAHHGKSYKELCWELLTKETTDAIFEDTPGYGYIVDQ